MAKIFDSFTQMFKDTTAQYKSAGTDMAKKYSADAATKAKEFTGQSQGFLDKLKGSLPSFTPSSASSVTSPGKAPVSPAVPMSKISKSGTAKKSFFKSKKSLFSMPVLVIAGVGIYFLTRRTRRK